MTIVLNVALALVVIFTVGVLASKSTYSFSWAACFWLKREARRLGVNMYVSRGPLFPIAVYWLGSRRTEEDCVAAGMVLGDVPMMGYADSVTLELNQEAITAGKRAWPTPKIRSMLGSPEDLCPGGKS